MLSYNTAPFKLKVDIKSAENLPIADITTSDPYIVLSIGPRTLYRSETIFRNHLNPQWNETLYTGLLHTKYKLLVSVFDHDKGKDDDLLGTLIINLESLPKGKKIDQKYALTPAGNFKSNARLYLNFLLERNENIISIKPLPIFEESSLFDSKAFQSFIAEELQANSSPNLISNTLKKFENSMSDVFDYDLIKDLIRDVNFLSNAADIGSLYIEKTPELFNRNILRLVNSTVVNFDDKKCSRFSPIEENCIQLNLSSSSTRFVLLQFNNRFSMWVFARWLLTMYDVWKSRLSLQKVPYWATVGYYTCQFHSVQTSDGIEYGGGRGLISFKNPFELELNNQKISLHPLFNMVLSANSLISKAYVLELEVITCDVTGEDLMERNDPSDNHHRSKSVDNVKQQKKNNILMHAIKGTVKGATTVVKTTANVATTVVTTASGVAVGVTTEVAHTALGAVRTIATGDPVNIFNSAQEKVIGYGKDLASSIHAAPDTLFGKERLFLLLNCEGDSPKLNGNQMGITDRFYIDVSTNNIDTQNDFEDFSRSVKRKNKVSQPERHTLENDSFERIDIQEDEDSENEDFFPKKDSSLLGVDTLLYGGTAHSPILLAQKHVPLRDLCIDPMKYNFKETFLNEADPEFTDKNLLKHKKSGNYGSTRITEFKMNSNLGFSVTFVRGYGLAVDPTNGRSMFLRGRLTDANGHSTPMSTNDKNTTPVPTIPNPDLGHQSFVFRAIEASLGAQFVRVEILVEGLKHTRLGAIFIPLEYFKQKSRTYLFPVVRWRQTNMGFKEGDNDKTLGKIEVTVRRIEEEGGGAKLPGTLKLRSTLRESNIFNSKFFSEALPAGGCDVTEKINEKIEKFTVYCAFSCLELHELHPELPTFKANETIQGTSSHDSENQGISDQGLKAQGPFNQSTVPTNSTSSTVAWDQGKGRSDSVVNSSSDGAFVISAGDIDSGNSGVPEMLVEVFENQRRTPYYPFDWSSHAYTRAKYSDQDFSVSYKFKTLEVAVPPEGYEWVTNWQIDKDHVKTDANGWIYGFTFRRILSNYKKRKSHTDPMNCHARRRKWVRKAQPIPAVWKQFDSFRSSQRLSSFQTLNQESDHVTSNLAMCVKEDEEIPIDNSSSSRRLGLIRQGLTLGASAINAVGLSNSGKNQNTSSNWRTLPTTTGLLGCCEERLHPGGPIRIPWEQVLACSVLTSSVLSVYVSVRRFFGEDSQGASIFRPAEVEIFVSNCPARELQSLLMERKYYHGIRGQIQRLIRAGHLSGNPESLTDQVPGEPTLPTVGEEEEDSEEGDIPETEELSMGAELIADLDDLSLTLEARYAELSVSYQKGASKLVSREMDIVQRRNCRLRLYMATLLGANLQGNVEIVPKAMYRLLSRDFKRCRFIELNTEVATACNRIEFLLDSAEQHIREISLCGWASKDTTLLPCMQVLICQYFVEIIDQLGPFFESGDTEVNVAGLTSKVDLITAYLKFNDRLDIIIRSALRAYDWETIPSVKLSEFLSFDKLLNWYSSVLLFEMRQRATDVVSVWSDPKRDVTGCQELYNFPLPWIPHRTAGGEGSFCTMIPEDMVEILMTYVQHARVSVKNIAPTFRSSIGRLDSRVELSFVSTFLYLCEMYKDRLDSKEWSFASPKDEDLDEISTWLSSMANDARRVVERDFFSVDQHTTEERMIKSSSKTQERLEEMKRLTRESYEDVMYTALDHFSCMQLEFLFKGREHWLTLAVAKVWRDEVIKGDEDSKMLIHRLLDDLYGLIELKADFLDPYPFSQLFIILMDKFVTFYLWFLNMLWKHGEVFSQDGPEIAQICEDIMKIESFFLHSELVDVNYRPEVNEWATVRLGDLRHCYSLLNDDLASSELYETVEKLRFRYGYVEFNNPYLGDALAEMAEKCLALRGVEAYMSTAQRKSLHNDDSGKQAAKKRGSLFGLFGKNQGKKPAPQLSRMSTIEQDMILAEENNVVKEEAVVRCIAQGLEQVRKAGVLKDTMLKPAPGPCNCLLFVNSVQQVFGKVKIHIEILLLHSALPVEKRIHFTPKSLSAPQKRGTYSIFSIFSRNRKQSSEDMGKLAPVADKKDAGVPASAAHIPVIDSPLHASWKLPEGVPTLVVNDLQVSNLFYIDSFSNPHPYLLLQIGGYSVRTEALDVDTSANWSDTTAAVVLPIYSLEHQKYQNLSTVLPRHSINNTVDPQSSLCELAVSLYYKGFASDQLIGTVFIKFAPFVIPSFKNRIFPMELEHIYAGNRRVLQAAERAKEEGRELPAISLSISDNNSSGGIVSLVHEAENANNKE